MASVITMDAEKKKLKLSNRKQALAPNHWTNRPAMAGLIICDPCTACVIRPLMASKPVAGASARTATDCAGTKKLDTRAHRQEDDVDDVEVAHEHQHQNQNAAYQVARDHGPFHVPLVDEDARQRADHRQRQHISDQDHADLRGGAVQLKCYKTEDREDRQEAAEDTDQLGEP